MSLDGGNISKKTIAEYAHIRIGILNGLLSTMLTANVFSMTLLLSCLDTPLNALQRDTFSLIVFMNFGAVILFLLASHYIKSITHRLGQVDTSQLSHIAKIAKRFFIPFVLCSALNAALTLIGALALMLGFWM